MQTPGTAPRQTALSGLIAKLCPRDGSHATAIPGVYLTRSSTVKAPRTSLSQAVLCVVAQGAKSIPLNSQRCVYDPSRYLLVSLDLPLVGEIEEATVAKPFLGWSMVLNFPQIAELTAELGLRTTNSTPVKPGPVVGLLDEDLLDAVIRLTRLLQQAAHIPVLAPIIQREIYYRLLVSENSDCCNAWRMRTASCSEWRVDWTG